MIITFATSKGGAGKSTACLCLAGVMSAHQKKVHIIDLDETGTTSRWFKTGQRAGANPALITVDKCSPDDIKDVLEGLQGSSEPPNFILMDIAGAYEKAMLQAMNRSNLVIIPAQASEPDIYEAQRVRKDLGEVNEYRSHAVPYRLLVTVFKPLDTPIQKHAIGQITELGFERFDTVMTDRSPYKEIFVTGGIPHNDTTGRQSVAKAKAELEDLYTEVIAALKLQPIKEAAL